MPGSRQCRLRFENEAWLFLFLLLRHADTSTQEADSANWISGNPFLSSARSTGSPVRSLNSHVVQLSDAKPDEDDKRQAEATNEDAATRRPISPSFPVKTPEIWEDCYRCRTFMDPVQDQIPAFPGLGEHLVFTAMYRGPLSQKIKIEVTRPFPDLWDSGVLLET
ncbi:hypothetical protein F5876DRAFT_70983 [Lentinula aff. lateritia]|uniref:Uncharacterized protein n=1 Tax=Lentinula aff. lateritia TaxID=2804960 RepID=A0ACC1THE2_9AGAR|nr:hypothetical protein F5876DRAFT_70983 [Lentinula aff. lateritia]